MFYHLVGNYVQFLVNPKRRTKKSFLDIYRSIASHDSWLLIMRGALFRSNYVLLLLLARDYVCGAVWVLRGFFSFQIFRPVVWGNLVLRLYLDLLPFTSYGFILTKNIKILCNMRLPAYSHPQPLPDRYYNLQNKLT